MPKLIHFLRKLVRETITIELKDDTVVCGSLVGVDSAMNTHVRNVLITRPFKTEQESLESMTVRGSSIRYILLPQTINLELLLSEPPKVPKGQQQMKEEKETKTIKFQQRKF